MNVAHPRSPVWSEKKIGSKLTHPIGPCLPVAQAQAYLPVYTCHLKIRYIQFTIAQLVMVLAHGTCNDL